MPHPIAASAAALDRTPDPPCPLPVGEWGKDRCAEVLSWTAQEVRALDTEQARAASDVLLRRLRTLDRTTEHYSRVRSRLVELNMALVRYATRPLTNRAASREDVLQTGTVGLIKAIDAFDPDRGSAFVSFALPTIRGEVKRLFRDTCWAVHVPRGQQELFLAVTRAADNLHQQTGRDATDAEIAAHLGVGDDDVAYGRDADRAYRVGSLDTPATTDASHSPTSALAGRIGVDEAAYDMVDFRESVRPLITELDSRDQQILKLRFWDGLTQRQIGQRLGFSQMHISRLLAAILTRLRDGLESSADAAPFPAAAA